MKFLIIAITIITIFSACKKNESSNAQEKTLTPKTTEYTKSLPEVKKTEITLGEAVTSVIDKQASRLSNINLACISISGYEISPGNEFSFNNVVGERTVERGYKEAAVLSNGEVCMGIGGGICQVSTTVYMAAKNANLKIKERHLHSKPVAYAPGRTDATVVYGKLDMRFENTTEDIIHLYTWVENESVYAKITKIDYNTN